MSKPIYPALEAEIARVGATGAELADACGCLPPAFSHKRTGKTQFTLEQAFRLKRFLGTRLTLDQLFAKK